MNDNQKIRDRIAAMPAHGPLPRRTVIVARAGVGHRLRCGLIEGGRVDLLVGTAFVTVKALAAQVLQAAGIDYQEGESQLRLSRLRVLFRQGLDPEYFGRDLVLSTPGWQEALVRTIGDLERAGVSKSDVAGTDAAGIDTPVGRGLAYVWQALDEAAGVSLTRAGLVARAALALEQTPAWAGDWGSVLAVVFGHAEGVEARFISAIPCVQLALRTARPWRDGFAARVQALFGAAAQSMPPVQSVQPVPSDLDILHSYLFASPEEQSSTTRRCAGATPDGSVLLEEHAGVAAEIEAAADWVARQVLEQGTPLEQIAVLLPRLDPLAQLVSDRLRRLPWETEFPVHVAGSCALTSSSSGGRMLTVLAALGRHLSVDAVADVLPLLRCTDDHAPKGGGPHRWIPRGAAIDLAQSLGTVGGSVAHPRGALEWTQGLDQRQAALAANVVRAQASEGDEEHAGLARGLYDTQRQLRDLQGVRPGLEQLLQVAAAVLDQRSLTDVWLQLKECLQEWVLPDDDLSAQAALAALAAVVEPACEDAMCRDLRGNDALGLIEAALLGLRLPVGRFGDPAVYVGTVGGAVGLPFQAVRIMGLVDGTIPASSQQDTVLPDEVRECLGQGLVTTAADKALRSLHELYQVVADTGRELVLSTPRLGLNRSYREPSSLFLEVAHALGRPGPVATVHGIIDLEAIRHGEFVPAQRRASTFRRAHPLGEAAWQDRAAEDRRQQRAPAVPAGWLRGGALDLARIAELQRSGPSLIMEGILGADAEGPVIAGMARQKPLSASRWKTFLSCPHHFLYENLLGWAEPAGPRPERELDALAYGSLFHHVLEGFFNDQGEAFWAQQGTLDDWQRSVAAVATAAFDELMQQYPLAGQAVQSQQLARLQRELHEFVAFLWSKGPGQFVAAERAFGFDEPVALAAGVGSIFVRGFVDLIYQQGKTTTIWDVKTGKCHPRRGKQEGPMPVVDAQVALYGLVAVALARQWQTTAQVQVAYVHTNHRAGHLREFADDFDGLVAAGNSWLTVTAQLLAQRSFPRSTSADDCMFCPFLPVCGSKATASSAASRPGADAALQAFAEMRS